MRPRRWEGWFCGPEPDKRNESAKRLTAIAAIAEIKQVPPEQVVAAVVANTRARYGF